MDYAAIKTELQDPSLSGLSDAAAATSINAKVVSTLSPLPTPKLLIWAADQGVLAAIQAVSVNAGSPLQSAALAVMLAISGGVATFDLSDPKVQTMLGAFVAAAIISGAARDAIIALATTTQPHTQVAYGVPYITAADVAHARSL